jgi:ketosteroid isomerase-like protein
MGDKDDIAKRRSEFVAALNREDVPALETFVTEDVVALPPGRAALRGKRAVRDFWREGIDAAKSRFQVAPGRLEVAGDIAVDEFRWSLELTSRAGGKPVHDQGKCIWIWRLERDGAWRNSHAIWNSDLSHVQTVWTGATAKG